MELQDKDVKRAVEINEVLNAVAILEYHDMNWFNSTVHSRMEMKQDLLTELKRILSRA